MRLISHGLPFLAAAGLTLASSPPSPSPPAREFLFQNPSLEAQAAAALKIPSERESALQARRILYLESIATFSTVFPSASTSENRPKDVQNAPVGLMEYYALCAPEPYNPTIIGIEIATTMRNADAGSNVTLSLRYRLPEDAPQPPPDPWAYIPANLPRFSMIGYLERFTDDEVDRLNVTGCFFETHPDSRIWAPGSDIHDAYWGRLVVKEVYFFGGFGDRARISWIPLDVWQGITQKEIEEYRLVGEHGYERGAYGGAETEVAWDMRQLPLEGVEL